MELGNSDFWVALSKLAVFAVFITAIIEVIKGVAVRGVFAMVKELLLSLWRNNALSTDSVKVLTFIVALIYCKVFEYGVMSNLLQLDFKENALAFKLDYIGTASLVYMGAGWVFDQFNAIRMKLKTQLEEVKKEP